MRQPNSAEVKARSYNIATLIQKELRNLPCVSKECCIYRVSKRLVNINPTIYEPQLISIGPFHHDQKDLKPMEQFKLQFLCRYLSRLSRLRLLFEGVVKAAFEWETKARKCYEDFAINMNSHDFVRMMLVDGCFIVEFLVAVYGKHPRTSRVDPLVFKAMNINLYHDLIMLENQLPFFVIQGLFGFIQPNNDDRALVNAVHNFFQANFMKHYCEIPSNIDLSPEKNIRHLVDFLGFYYSPATRDINQGNNKLLFLPPSTTELYEAGVILEKAITTKDYNIMDISFEGALISKEKDSSLLMKKGIISNLIGGSDEEVSNMFNNIGKGVTVQGHFYYESISRNLHKHCDARRNRWMATLKRDYFNTPWTIVSLIGATILGLLTLLQTALTVYRYR